MKDLDEEKLSDIIYKLIDYLEGYVYTKNRIDLYKKEGLGLMIALEENDLDDMDDVEKHSDLYVQEFRSEDGISKTSKTKSAEQYLQSIN